MLRNIKNNGLQPSTLSKNPIAASLVSKFNRDKTDQVLNPSNLNLPDISSETQYRISNNEDILTMFPDVELAMQILTSSILAPNDMIQNKIIFNPPEINLQSAITQTILSTIEDYINKTYDFNSNLSNILKETLFTKGAYIEAIIPEASLDDIISQQNYIPNNTGIESYFRPTGKFLFNNKTNVNFTVSKEDLSVKVTNKPVANSINVSEEDLGITITDNYNILNLNNLLVQSVKYKNKTKFNKGVSLEADKPKEPKEQEVDLDKLFRDKTYYKQQDYVKVTTMQNASRESLTKPLIIKLPTQAVIPVHVISEPSKHLGYFIVLDENGSPLNFSNTTNPNDNIDFYATGNLEQEAKLNLINKAKGNLMGSTKADIMLNGLEDIYSQLIDSMLKEKLKNSDYKDLVEIEEHTELYRVMLYRALKSQQTKIVFIPEELVAYYAFEYRDNGTGKSWLEKNTVFFSLKAILLFSRVMASLKNGTSITEITANLDEHDTDPQGRMEQIKSEVLKTRQSALPLGVIRPDDLADWVQKNGLRFKFNHPRLTNLDISTNDMTTSKTVPDEELEQKINEYIYMSFGLTPEIVEAGYSTDYATTVVAKNLLFAKRLVRLQTSFCSMLTDHIRKLLSNDIVIINELKDIVKSNMRDIKKHILKKKKEEKNNKSITKINNKDIEDYIINSFLNELTISLPEPETQQANNLKEAFDDYKSTLEETLDIVFNTSAIPNDYIGNIADKVDAIKEMFKASSLMKWMSDNGYMPELAEAVTKDDEGNFIFNPLEEYSHFLESLGESFLPFIKRQQKIKTKMDEKLEKAENPEDTSSDTGDDDMDNEDTENENEENTDEEVTNEEDDTEDTALDSGDTGDEQANDALADMDQMDMGADNIDSLGNSNAHQEEEDSKVRKADDMEKLQALLMESKIAKERALADRAKAEAIHKIKDYGLTPEDLEKMRQTGVKVNPKALRINKPEPKPAAGGGEGGGGEDEFGMDMGMDDMGSTGDDFAADMGDAGDEGAGDALAAMDNMDEDTGGDKKEEKEDKKEEKDKKDDEGLESFLKRKKIFKINI